MGKLIYMNATIAMFTEESIQNLMKHSEIKALDDSFYVIVNEKEE